VEYQVPSAILTLKQGFGRLIRTTNDQGILALLDSRLLHKQYGQQFLKSFDRYPLATSLNDLIKILPRGLID
jgi:ATP-dependent DNA helicase DinG